MDVQHQVFQSHDFLRTTVSGELDLAASKAVFQTLIEQVQPPPRREILVDYRDAVCRVSTAQIFELARFLAALWPLRQHRIALLVRPEDFDSAEFAELCAQNRGLILAAFSRLEDADRWLNAPIQELME